MKTSMYFSKICLLHVDVMRLNFVLGRWENLVIDLWFVTDMWKLVSISLRFGHHVDYMRLNFVSDCMILKRKSGIDLCFVSNLWKLVCMSLRFVPSCWWYEIWIFMWLSV